MADFKHFVTHVFRVEGGYSKSKTDKGNYNSRGQLVGTKYGISAPTLEHHLSKIISVKDMLNLAKETALKIYKTLYWDVCKTDKFSSQSVANIIADHSVNASPLKASRLLYDIVNKHFGGNLKVKSIITNELVDKVNSLSQELLFEKIKAERIQYYKNIGGSNLRGWLNRMATFNFES